MSAAVPMSSHDDDEFYRTNPFFLSLIGRGEPKPVEDGEAWEAAGAMACQVLARFTVAGQQRGGGAA